jgi:hypothetical protein
MHYLINRGGQQFGPYPLPDIHNMLAQGQIAPNDLAWCEGTASVSDRPERRLTHSL